MHFTQAALQDPNVLAHFQELRVNRDVFNIHHNNMVAQYAPALQSSPTMLAANALGGFDNTFWAAIDRQVIALRGQEFGIEIVDDLMGIQLALPVGKTAAMYNNVGDIADDVAISIDGQAPYSFDHTDYGNDGDPIPMFTAGYGVNWRMQQGLQGVGIDLVLDSQEAKMRKFNKRLVNYVLNGDASINVDGKPGQGLKNHRNTYKINLGTGAGGAAIDLTTATPQEIIDFFTTGAMGQAYQVNFLTSLSVLWVSPQIWRNLRKQYVVEMGAGGLAMGQNRTVLEAIKQFLGVEDVRQSYALVGNEFLGYVRRADYVRPLVGMTTGVVPLPRLMPQANYNFQIMCAMGIQVRADSEGHTGVIYGADLS